MLCRAATYNDPCGVGIVGEAGGMPNFGWGVRSKTVTHRAAVLVFAATAGMAAPSLASDWVKTIETGGSGVFTVCRSWMLFSTCKDYNRVVIPTRVSVGDTLRLDYGTNTKKYLFPVGRILRDDNHCKLFTEPAGGTDDVNRIDVSPCHELAALP